MSVDQAVSTDYCTVDLRPIPDCRSRRADSLDWLDSWTYDRRVANKSSKSNSLNEKNEKKGTEALFVD